MRVVGTAAAILILLVAGGVTVAQSGRVFAHHPGSTAKSGPRGHGYTTAVDATQRAAVWVSQQVSRNVIVACDPLMCSDLKAQGVPAGKLLILRTSKTSLLGAEVVVATPTLRSQFGTRLDSQYAPSVMAGFGSGPSQVNVLVVAKDGAAAYRAALRQDVAARKAAGRQLLANRRIAVSGQTAAQLRDRRGRFPPAHHACGAGSRAPDPDPGLRRSWPGRQPGSPAVLGRPVRCGEGSGHDRLKLSAMADYFHRVPARSLQRKNCRRPAR